MSIRAIAQEVYRCQARVHKLEDQLQQALPRDQERLRQELKQAMAELKVVKRMLDGRKAQAGEPKDRFPFYRR